MTIKHIFTVFAMAGLSLLAACTETLEPKPVDLLTDDIALNSPNDVENAEVGLYNSFRPVAPATVIAGDCMADLLVNNGTFGQYIELGTKQVTSANASVATLWASLYSTIYTANFILERLPQIVGVPTATRDRVMATAHFLRGYCYFIGVTSYGGIPLVTTTDIDINRNIARATEAEILQFVLDDYNAAQGKLPAEPASTAYASDYALQAAFARFYLYQKNWAAAETFSGKVIDSKKFGLDSAYADVVTTDFPEESIFEMGYTLSDDPGTNGSIGLNNIFSSRREMVPTNQTVVALASDESGERFSSISFKVENLKGADNGWSVAKYGTADEDNNNVMVFRLAEMYLIRAEARAQQGKVSGDAGAEADINVLRKRAKAPTVNSSTQSAMLQVIENERVYELAFEGHRWYDLVRTGRANTVMPSSSPNWKATYNVWPIPLNEMQYNPAMSGSQNPGY